MKRLSVYLAAIGLLSVSGLFAHTEGKSEVDTEALFEKKCSICHSIDKPKSTKKTKKGWGKTVKRMKKNGCPITDEEAKIIIDYLAENYGKKR